MDVQFKKDNNLGNIVPEQNIHGKNSYKKRLLILLTLKMTCIF